MKILAVDYGDSRTGLATCDRTEFLSIVCKAPCPKAGSRLGSFMRMSKVVTVSLPISSFLDT